MEQDLKAQSKLILNALGMSFAASFSPTGIPDDESVEALLEALDRVHISRDAVLEQTNARLETLLSKNPQ